MSIHTLIKNVQTRFSSFRHIKQGLRFASSVPLTSERYPVPRGEFSKITSQHIEHFKGILGNSGVIENEDETASYLQDWIKKYRGQGSVVLRPKTTQQVSDIMKFCNENKLAVVPQGGNTGLVGGSVPVFDEIVLSTSLMNKVNSFDSISGILNCQAGCVLEQLDTQLQADGFIMPLDLGAKGSCQIGGNVSTNAGGIRFLRYGSLHGSVLGLEVVLADGRILNSMSPCRKDNTGYDLKQLFIGSEGTLGIVTGVSLLTPNRSNAVNAAFLGCESYESVLAILQSAKKDLGEVLSACEFLDNDSMGAAENLPGVANPLSDNYPFYMLIETSGSNNTHDTEKLDSFLENVMENGYCVDGIVAQDLSQINQMWKVREGITEGLLHDGMVYKYDISIPLTQLYEIVTILRERTEDLATRVCGYGHVCDGNLHLNITSKEYNKELEKIIEPFVYEWTSSVNGSVSAEHGLGFMKSKCIGYSKSEESIDIMHSLKTVLDPNGILNPYKTVYRNPLIILSTASGQGFPFSKGSPKKRA